MSATAGYAQEHEPVRHALERLEAAAAPVNWGAFAYCERLKRVYRRVNVRGRISLQEAADVAFLEHHYFSSYFRRKTRITFSKWRDLMVLHRALDLLLTSDLSVGQIVTQVHMERRTFERSMRALSGSTVCQLRRQLEAPEVRAYALQRSISLHEWISQFDSVTANSIHCAPRMLDESERASALAHNYLRQVATNDA